MWKNWFKCKRHPDRVSLAVADNYHFNFYHSGSLSELRPDRIDNLMAPNYHLWWDGFKYVKL